LKKSGLLCAALVVASIGLVSCSSGVHVGTPPSGLTERVMAAQSASSPAALAGLVIIDGQLDTLARGEVVTGGSPSYMVVSPSRATLLAFDSLANKVDVVNTKTEALAGSIPLAGATISMAIPNDTVAYAAVPDAPFNGAPQGGVVVMNLTAGVITATIGVPNAQMVVANPSGTQLLVFSGDNITGSVTVVSPLLLNTGVPVTATVTGFDYPVNAVFSADGSTAYILNCGPECGSASASASVQTLDMASLAVGAQLPVDGATIGFLNGSTLWVAGTPTASASNPTPNNACTGETTAATTCGRLDTVDVSSMTVTGSAVITDGYHDRIDLGLGGQLFIGSHACTNEGNVNNPQGEVRGCLSIFNAVNGTVVIPPDNGDVTGLQSFTTRYVEYVAEGGNLRVYNTTTDMLEAPNEYISDGTIVITGVILDAKAVDFF